VVDQATARRRALIAGILVKLPTGRQHAVAEALRAFADAMRPFRPPLAVPARDAGASADDGDSDPETPDWAALAGPVSYQHDPQAVFATESLAQALRQLEVYGRDGLPVLSASGDEIDGWVTSTSVLRSLASQIAASRADAVRAELAADWDHADADSCLRDPPAPLSGYRLLELTVTGSSPAAGARLGAIGWPPGTVPVSVLRDRAQRAADPSLSLRPGDRITLLTRPSKSSTPS
jgi:chloride channel protein, CIC family